MCVCVALLRARANARRLGTSGHALLVANRRYNFMVYNSISQLTHLAGMGIAVGNNLRAGEWLEFEEGNDPWQRSKHAMCNMWDEWVGMRETVLEEQAKTAG